MPVYKATIEVEMDGDDIDWLHTTVNQWRDYDGITISDVELHDDNPPDYPDEEDEDA